MSIDFTAVHFIYGVIAILLLGSLVVIIKLYQRSEYYREERNKGLMENLRLTSLLQNERTQTDAKLETLHQAQHQLSETFQNLTSQALLHNNQTFLSLAQSSFEKFFSQSRQDLETRQQRFSDLVDPVQKSLHQVDQKMNLLEKERIDAYSDLRRQIYELSATQKDLRLETANLVKALRAPTTRGQWGEMQLKRVVEMAGMIAHCDFIEQVRAEEGRFRPDMVINLPGGKKIIVDAKAPLAAYLEAVEAVEDSKRRFHLEEHARQVRTHIRNLSQKAYWEKLQPTPEFVIMFLPGEAFFSSALEKDPSLIEAGVQEQVILATPTTLIALLRAVAFGWRQENLADNARIISELGRELYKRLGDMNENLGKVGRSLNQAVDSYNQTVGTFERRVLVSARKLTQLDSSLKAEDLSALSLLDSTARSVQPSMQSAEE